MFLKTIKLVGFKSFVDATVIAVHKDLNAIVGPNGCGKSNVVDAVRWVIGELSAKQLRTQSMADVIFNGSSARKPVGKAMVELVFDNSDGKVGGEYAKFGEISIRREVEREGPSIYFINGVACRRKDIIDIFLGTGLGTRGYAVIEQGVISQLVEAKPDEMRAHIEEVAGISKYKERRRETESRMKRTQENLDRVNDITEELGKQLRHLKRQANAAERYKVFKQEQRLLQAQIKALNWQDLAEQLHNFDQKVATKQVEFEQHQAKLREVEVDSEKNREEQVVINQAVQEVQRRFYGLGSEIAKLEQKISYHEEQVIQWNTELQEVSGHCGELTETIEERSIQVGGIQHDLDNLQPKAQELTRNAASGAARLLQAEQGMEVWQQDWESFSQQCVQAERDIEVARNTIQHSQNQINNLTARAQRLQDDQNDAELQQLEQDINQVSSEVEAKEQTMSELQQTLGQLKQDIAEQRTLIHDQTDELEDQQKQLRGLQSQFMKLEALQKAALGANNESVNQWLEQHKLDQHPRLVQSMQVKSGWETAVETVLQGQFDAVCVENTADLIADLAAFNEATLTCIDSKHVTAVTQPRLLQYPTLLQKVACDWSLESWLTGVYIATDITEAIQIRSQLSNGESVITQDGIWLGLNWLRVSKAVADEDSILMREEKLKLLQVDIDDRFASIDQFEQQLQQAKQRLQQLEEQSDDKQQDFQEQSRELTQSKSELSGKQSRYQQMQQQQQKIVNELQECHTQMATSKETLASAQQVVASIEDKQADVVIAKQNYLQRKESVQTELNQAREEAQSTKQAADEWGIRVSSNETQLQVLNQSLSRDQRQLSQWTDRRAQLTGQLENSDEPACLLKQELQTQLDQRLLVENEMQKVEQHLAQCNQAVHDFEQQHQQSQAKVNASRDWLQSLQMEKQTITVRQTTLNEQLAEDSFKVSELIADLPEEANLSDWQQRIEVVESKLNRLGSINLAAIEEYETLSERKDYLDKQKADLDEALGILQSAMKKIDNETRSKFRETFDKVNEGFGRLFPKIFSGGSARLEMLENDLLTSGVAIKAQPPGKRNGSIHMLSGGEKALTAIALVFAMFQLNPAPFCILDEVDAPLDDVNVGRLCHLIAEMADEIQFIIISHNKVTIESASHLMGVTMQEAGVSRIVSVDMEQAVEMAEA